MYELKFKAGDKVKTSVALAKKSENSLFGIAEDFWDDDKVYEVEEGFLPSLGESAYYSLYGSLFSWPEYALVKVDEESK